MGFKLQINRKEVIDELLEKIEKLPTEVLIKLLSSVTNSYPEFPINESIEVDSPGPKTNYGPNRILFIKD